MDFRCFIFQLFKDLNLGFVNQSYTYLIGPNFDRLCQSLSETSSVEIDDVAWLVESPYD